MWSKWLLISVFVSITFGLDESNYQNDDVGIIKQFKDVQVQSNRDPDSIVYGLDDGNGSGTIVKQRNYQTISNSNFNLDNNDSYNIEYKYHDYEKMTRFLRETTSRFPSLTALYSIGKSVQGKWFFQFFF